MPKSSKSPGWQDVTKQPQAAVEEIKPEKHGIVEKAGEVVQTVLGTMAGVVSGIGILVTGTEAEKKARQIAAKKAAKKAPAKKAAGKRAPAKKAATKKAAPKKVAAKKTAKKAARKRSS